MVGVVGSVGDYRYRGSDTGQYIRDEKTALGFVDLLLTGVGSDPLLFVGPVGPRAKRIKIADSVELIAYRKNARG